MSYARPHVAGRPEYADRRRPAPVGRQEDPALTLSPSEGGVFVLTPLPRRALTSRTTELMATTDEHRRR
jgi:hypothetical protein